MTVGVWVHFQVFTSIQLIHLPVTVPMPCNFYHYCSVVQHEVRDGDSPEVLLLLRIVFTILGFLLFQMNLRIAFSNSTKNLVEILMGIALNLQFAFCKMAIFTILILLIHAHRRSFHLLSSQISFFRDLNFLSYRYFTCLVSHTKVFYIVCDYCEGCHFPNFFLSSFIP